jgi:hypothetical protein
MNGDLVRTIRAGAWVALALGALSACNATPEAKASAGSAPVVESVRVATDRSGITQDAVTLPNGQRIRRLTLRNGFNHVMIARFGPDGKSVVSCVDSAPDAEAFLSAGGAGQ